MYLVEAQDTSQKGELAKQTTTLKNTADSTSTKAIIPNNRNVKTVELPDEKKNTVVPIKTNRYGLRVGIDLYKLTRGLYDKDYKGIEFVGDYRLNKKIFFWLLKLEMKTKLPTIPD